jgi:hypothetical protein
MQPASAFIGMAGQPMKPPVGWAPALYCQPMLLTNWGLYRCIGSHPEMLASPQINYIFILNKLALVKRPSLALLPYFCRP